MVDKADQIRLRELMREAVTMLCKTGITFESKFSVEGLLGITVDDRDIMLINLNETVVKYDSTDNLENYHSNSEVKRNAERIQVIEAEPIEHPTHLQIEDSDSADSLILTQAAETEEQTSSRHNVSNSQNKQVKRKNTDCMTHHEATAEEKRKAGFFSPAVDQIIQEYEQQQYTDSSSLLYMARKRRRKYPEHVTELHTQGLIPILPHSEPMISILPQQVVQAAPPQILVPQTQNKVVIQVKKEPGTADTEDTPVQSKKSRSSIEPITIEPKSTWSGLSSKVPLSAIPSDSSSLAIMASVAANATMDDTLWVEDAILRQEGCYVSTRVILRKHGALRGENVVQAMKCMTYRRGDPRYVGEYRQSGRIQVFYKCPPYLLSSKALERYNMTLDQYSNYFFGNPKPNNGTPSQWSAYISTVLDGIPYDPKLFPIESMNLDEDEYRKLSTKRDMLADRFISLRDDDPILGGFRADDTDGCGT